MREHRKHARKSVSSPIVFQIGNGPPIEAQSQDISLGGMFIHTTTLAPYGALIQITIDLPGLHAAKIDAVVRWSKDLGMGVQFASMGARATLALTRLISQ